MSDSDHPVSEEELAKRRADSSAFALATFVGALIIGGGKFVGAPQGGISLVVVLVIVAYSVASAKSPQIKLRIDQVGDNAYYLGLLFTMGSMMASLIVIGGGFSEIVDGSLGQEVIGDFGIALISTLVGLFIRVICQQMRTDPGDVEEATREDLAAAAASLSADMRRAQLTMGQAADEISQSAMGTIQRMTERCAQMLEDANERLNERHLQTAEQVSEILVSASKKIDAIVEPLNATHAALEATAGQVVAMVASIEKVAKTGEALSEGLVTSQKAVGEATTRFSESHEQMAQLIKLVRDMTTETMENRIRIASELAERMKVLTQAHDRFAKQGEELSNLVTVLKSNVEVTGASATAAADGAAATLKELTAVASQLRLDLDSR